MKNTDNNMNDNNTNADNTNEKYRQWYECTHTMIIIRMKNTDNDMNENIQW